ncbi:hypothetical protein ABZW03_26195 [Kitasatospora sp. NPDC004799]|uniref:hypothetical protein n=1 Tax=Kitasatospora sp. NPDC004799 TaxID=3154460 RepID=UPI0033A70898
MPYEYWCGVCRTVSEHVGEAEAEAERRAHIAAVHHGRRPDRERIRDLQPVPRAPQHLSRRFGATPALAVVAVILAALIAWSLHLDPPAAPHSPPRPALPTPQPWESLFSNSGASAGIPAHPGP